MTYYYQQPVLDITRTSNSSFVSYVGLTALIARVLSPTPPFLCFVDHHCMNTSTHDHSVPVPHVLTSVRYASTPVSPPFHPSPSEIHLGLMEQKIPERQGFRSPYRCTLCYHPLLLDSKPRTIGPHIGPLSPLEERCGRIICKACWRWIYSLAICWTCGEIVGRKEERVGFGWCWWHWGCLACVLCRVRHGCSKIRNDRSM